MNTPSERTQDPERRLLLADDNLPFTRALARWLTAEHPGWLLDTRSDAAQALSMILGGGHDAVLLDWHFGDGVEGLTGLEVCRRARAAGCTLPIVMLTAVDGVEERVAALDAGVDDFLVKGTLPIRELCRRIQVAFRRADSRGASLAGRVVSVGPITVHTGDQAVFVEGRLVSLPKRERHIVMRLARLAGEVVPYDDLCEPRKARYGPKYKKLQNEMWRLRSRLGDAAAKCLHTVQGVGYRLAEAEASDGRHQFNGPRDSSKKEE